MRPHRGSVLSFLCLLTVVAGLSLASSGGLAFMQASSQTACPAGLSWMGQYNLITLGDLSTSSDVELTTFVGGNYVGTSSANFGNHLDQNSFNAQNASLEVAGRINAGGSLNINAGSVLVGPNNSVQKLNNTQFTVNGRALNLNQGNQGAAASINSGLPAKATQIAADISALSRDLAQRTANNSVSIPTQPGPLVFRVLTKDAAGVAVFNLSAASVFGNANIQQIEIDNASNAQFIVINLSGSSVNWSSGNKVGSWLNSLDGRARTLWNFHEATSLNFQRNFMGALLAPNAAVATSVNLDGAVAVKSLTTSAEVHKPLLKTVCPLVPSPGTPTATSSATTQPTTAVPATATRTVQPTTAVPTSVATGACAVTYKVDQWNGGFVANVQIINNGPPINGWSLTWSFAGNQQISNAWNTRLTQTGQAVSARDAGHNATIATGGKVDFGFQASFSGTNTVPTNFSLNNLACNNPTTTATSTSVPPTATATNTAVPPTATATNTPTATATNTPVPPTATATNTPTATATNTPVPPTATSTPTATATNTATATATNTPTATSTPTATATNTPTATATNTPVPPTATSTPTATATSTATATATNTPTATATHTPVPPTATATNTPVPPTATNTPTATATNTPVPPTATSTPTATGTPPPPANGSISGTVWFDGDLDGVFSAEEFGISDMQVYLYLDDGDNVSGTDIDDDGYISREELDPDDLVVAVATTEYSETELSVWGRYRFDNLAPGQYWVWLDNAFRAMETTSNPYSIISVQGGQHTPDVNFGLYFGS